MNFIFRLLLVTTLFALAGCITQPVVAPEPETGLVSTPACAGQPSRKVLVTAFPLRYPEQIKSGEFLGWAELTGSSIQRRLSQDGKITAVAASQRFPFKSPELAPELDGPDVAPLIVQWAESHHAHYVLAGVFDDFGVANKAKVIPERQMRMEAYVFDAFDGKLLARRPFAKTLILGNIPATIIPGSREFDTSRLGKTYNEIVGEVSRWAENTVSCLPFHARVSKVEGLRVTLRVGSESGLKPGQGFQSWRPDAEPPKRHPGVPPSAKQLPTVVTKEVGLLETVAEIPQQRFPPEVKVGDVLYFSEGWRP